MMEPMYSIRAYITDYTYELKYGSVWATIMDLFIPPKFPYMPYIAPPWALPDDKGSHVQFSLPLEVHVRKDDGILFRANTGVDMERMEQMRTTKRITHTMYQKGVIYKKLDTRAILAFDQYEEVLTFDGKSMGVLDSRIARWMEKLRTHQNPGKEAEALGK